MKTHVLVFSLFLCCFLSCSSDPCADDANALDCTTGDFDMDGVLNGEDTAPEDACVPNKPSFETNVIGTWDYTFATLIGTVKINADGTYEDLVNEIVSSGPITSRTWKIENEELFFETQNAGVRFAWLSYDCNSFALDTQSPIGFSFTRQ